LKAEGIVETKDFDEDTQLDVDAEGHICALTIEHARERANLPSKTRAVSKEHSSGPARRVADSAAVIDDKLIVFSEHVLAYADSRGVTLDEIIAAIRTEKWHRQIPGRVECRKNSPCPKRAGGDTKQVRVVFFDEPTALVVVTVYGYLVRTKPLDDAVAA